MNTGVRYYCISFCQSIFMSIHQYISQNKERLFKREGMNTNGNAQSAALTNSNLLLYSEDFDKARLVEMLENKDRQIRKLQKRIAKLEETLAGWTQQRVSVQQGDKEMGNYHLELIQREIAKSQHLEYIINEIIQKVISLKNQFVLEYTITENSEEIKNMLVLLQNSSFEHASILSSEDESGSDFQKQWVKIFQSWEILIKSFKNKFAQNRLSLKRTTQELEKYKKYNLEEQFTLKAELKEQRRQKQKLKNLLQKSQLQKNELINRITMISLKEAQAIKTKSKQQLVQYAKQQSYRIKDLQRQKQLIVSASTKQKDKQLKKYQALLSKVLQIKDKSIIKNNSIN